MKTFLKKIIVRPVTICVLAILVLGAGIFAVIKMPTNLLPNMNLPMLGMTIVYPGASAVTAESTVTKPVENVLRTITGINQITSYSIDNASVFILEFDYGTDVSEKERAIETLMATYTLPSGANEPTFTTVNFNSTAVATISLYRSDTNTETLMNDANELAKQFYQINGVGEVKVIGEIETKVTLKSLEGLDLPLLLVANSLGVANSLDIPLGTIVQDDESISLRNQSSLQTIAELEALPIAVLLPRATWDKLEAAKVMFNSTLMIDQSDEDVASNSLIRDYTASQGFNLTADLVHLVRSIDFTTISYENDEGTTMIPLTNLCHVMLETTSEAYTQYNDAFSIIIEVYNTTDANTSETVEEVKSFLNNYGCTSTVLLLDDQAEFINDSIGNVLSSMIIGGFLAIIIIFLFIKKIRTSIVIAITMPLSVLAALVALWLMGTSLNMVSLGGLAVGIGMLVDNSIVVIESITKRREAGERILSSAINGTSEVAGSLLASTLTTVCVFFPILFTTGLTKEIFTDLSYAVIFSIVFSLVVAISIIPTLYCLIYRRTWQVEEKENCVVADKVLRKKSEFGVSTKLGAFYKRFLNKALRYKGYILIGAIIVFVLSISLVFVTGTEFLPSIDQGLIEVNISYDANTDLDDAKADALNCLEKVKETVPDYQYCSLQVGIQDLLDINVSTKISLQLPDKGYNTASTANELRRALDISKGIVSVTEIDGIVATMTSGMSGVSLTILGSDLQVLQEIATVAEPKLKELSGISNVTNDITGTKKEYSLKVDQAKCLEKSIDYQTLVTMLRAGIASYDVATMNLEGENLTTITIAFNEKTLASIDSILNIIIGFDDTGSVKVKDVATVTEIEQPSIIKRQDKNYMVNFSFEIYGIDTGTAVSQIEEVFDVVLLDYDGYEYVESGVNSYLTDAFAGLVVSLIVAFFLLFAIMACQFESLIKPFIVIISIPFAMTGGFIAIALTGTTLNVVSFIGLIMLMGVIVNNAIVMIDKIDLLQKEGMDALEAVKAGAINRLRAIIMTTLTTILALLPLAFGLGQGGELMQPMGIVVIGGLLIGTIVTLVLIPCFYCLMKKINTKGKVED